MVMVMAYRKLGGPESDTSAQKSNGSQRASPIIICNLHPKNVCVRGPLNTRKAKVYFRVPPGLSPGFQASVAPTHRSAVAVAVDMA